MMRTEPVKRYALIHEVENDVTDDRLPAEERAAVSKWRAAVQREGFQPIGEPVTELHHVARIGGEPMTSGPPRWNPMKQQFVDPAERCWRVLGRVLPADLELPLGFDIPEDMFWVSVP